MKHLVIGSDLFKPSIGGTETVTENMARELTKKGWRVTVVAPTQKHKSSPRLVKDLSGYDILRIRSIGFPLQQNLRFSLHAYSQIEEYFKKPENMPTIVHVNNPFATSKILLRFAKKNNLPIVIGSHLMPESFTTKLEFWPSFAGLVNNIGWRKITHFYNKADAVVSPTKTGINYLKHFGLTTKSYVISNGIDLSKNKPLNLSSAESKSIRRSLGLNTKYICIYAGRLGIEKQVDVIINAILKLQQNYDIGLILVGDGNATAKLKNLVNKLQISDKVIFTGFVKRQLRKKELLAISDMFAIASPVELQSIVTLEAMAAGLPIFACQEGALPELVKNNINGHTFKVGDSEELARQIGKTMQDPILLKQYSKASLQNIKIHDSKNTWIAYDNMYSRVIAESD